MKFLYNGKNFLTTQQQINYETINHSKGKAQVAAEPRHIQDIQWYP